VIGASSKPDKLGYKLVRNIVDGGYRGNVYPVNIKGETVHGLPSFRKIGEIEGPVDLAIISLPGEHVKEALEEVGEKGTHFAVIVSAGFRETGNIEGERELLGIAKRYGIRILGPNVFGLIYTPISLNAQFGPGDIMKGRVAIITQSGALGAALMGKAFEEGIGVSGVVSTGNKADICDEDLLDFFCSDENTDAILMYIEGLKDGRRFMDTVSGVSKVKPIIVVKSGTTELGARAVRSHTASLAGNDRIFDGAFRQTGVIRAPTIKDAIDWTRVLIDMPLPKRKEVLIITNGGGLGAIAVDELTKAGIPLFSDNKWIEKEMGEIFPPYATMDNPVDITAQVPYDVYLKGVEKALNEVSVGSLIGIYAPTSGADVPAFTKAILKTVGKPVKPIMICTFGGRAAMEQIQKLKSEGITAFYYPEEAVSSLATLYRYGEHVNEGIVNEEKRELWSYSGIAEILRRSSDGFLGVDESLELIESGPFHAARRQSVENEEELIKAFENLPKPVVLKVSEKEFVHKADKGGVKTCISDQGELLGGYCDLRKMSSRIIIMEQVSGPEMIIGAVRDPVFGPVIMFGLGGTLVEVLQDITFRVAPLTRKDAFDMMREIKTGSVLEGIRGKKAVDKDSLADLLISLSELMLKMNEIEEIEVNPLILTDEGPVAVDGRVKIGP
jgi:acetyltransferase